MAFGSVQTKTGGWVTGSGYNAYRAVLYYAINSEATRVTFNSQLAVQSGEGHDSLSNFTLKLNGATKTSSAYLNAGATVKVASDDGIVVNRTHATQSKTLSAYAAGGAWSGSSTASVSITVDPLASYAVTYNANGGSGAPAAQTKWYGETLTLSSTRPTRANYNFLGWSTSSTATSATYQPSASYTTNAALTLYAVWQLAATSPSITKLVAYRSDSSGNRIDDASTDTTNITIQYGWSVDTGASSRQIQFSLGGTAQTAITLSANSGENTVTYEKSLGIAATLAVSATLTDLKHSLSATRSVTVPVIFKPFSMTNEGLSAAFFGVASQTGNRLLKVFGSLYTIGYSIFARSMSLTSASTNPSTTQNGAELRLEDSTGMFTGRLLQRFNTSGEWLVLEAHRKLSGVDKYQTVSIGLDANCKPMLALSSTQSSPNAKQAWHKTISGWTQLASAKSGTEMSITTTSYNEILVCAVCTTTSSNVRAYAGSVVIPMALLSTTNTEWLLGGGDATNGTSGRRYASVKITTTKATGVGAYVDNTDRASTTTFYVYAR